MIHPRMLLRFAIAVVLISQTTMTSAQPPVAADDAAIKLPDEQITKINEEVIKTLEAQLSSLPAISDDGANAVDQYSRRGDLRMFLGQFKEAESDYRQMVKLKPDVDASHWRLGIAMYFAGHPMDAAGQFDKYNSFDNVDRENGIWRYLSHRAAFGKEKAHEQLLKYEKDDRPPFREVYRMFEGTMSDGELLQSISSDLPAADKNARLFYANLYAGLNLSTEGGKGDGIQYLREAVLNPWPREAGFGPNYMWHVGRLQLIRTQTPKK